MIYLIKDGDLITTEDEGSLEFYLSIGYKQHQANDAEVKLLLKKANAEIRISELKVLLANSDWKVIVNAELVQAGLEPKYPNLHAERQAWRDEINELE